MYIYPVYNHNWRNISTIYIYNKTSIKRNILTIKQNIYLEVGRAKDLSVPRYNSGCDSQLAVSVSSSPKHEYNYGQLRNLRFTGFAVVRTDDAKGRNL